MLDLHVPDRHLSQDPLATLFSRNEETLESSASTHVLALLSCPHPLTLFPSFAYLAQFPDPAGPVLPGWSCVRTVLSGCEWGVGMGMGMRGVWCGYEEEEEVEEGVGVGRGSVRARR